MKFDALTSNEISLALNYNNTTQEKSIVMKLYLNVFNRSIKIVPQTNFHRNFVKKDKF